MRCAKNKDMQDGVPEDSLEEPVRACIFCATTVLTPCRTFVQESPPVRLIMCSECKAQMVDHLPQREFLDKLYTESEYVGFLEGSQRLTRALARRLASEVRASWSTSVVVQILDYGGGSGSLARCLAAALTEHELRSQVTVVDIISGELGDELTFLTPDEFDACTQTFDVILCSAVIEHLRDPGFRLKNLYSRLNAGGWIYVRSPQLGGLKILRASWFRWPRHLSEFGPAFWRRFPPAMGWNVEFVWSRASRPETEWRTRPISTVVAIALKSPSFLELGLRRMLRLSKGCRYPWVGGWEFLGRKRATT